MTQTTVEDIRDWLEEGRKKGASHLIVACDTYDWSDYAVFVLPEQDINKAINAVQSQDMTKVMEVYCYAKDLEEQLKKPRSWSI